MNIKIIRKHISRHNFPKSSAHLMSTTRYYNTIGAIWAVLVSLLIIGLLVDHVPRFFQGDSISYLSTDGTYIPPDRSWAFGFASNWLLRVTGSNFAFMIIQLIIFLLTLMACVSLFSHKTYRSLAAYAAFVIVACFDPMLNLYVRFYMTDLLAALFFTTLLICMRLALQGPWSAFLRWMPAMFACMIGAVFTRVAYAPIAIITIIITLVWAIRFDRSMTVRVAAFLLLPIVAAFSLVFANTIVFSGRFPGEAFLNKSSGIFLLGAFAPALTAQDFRAAGVPVLDSEVALLDLPDYSKRGRQIWGTDEQSAQVLIRKKLNLMSDYPAQLDTLSTRIVLHAAERDPMAFARVYLSSLTMHFEPSQWQLFLEHEVGIDRQLPQGFVDYINRMAGPPIELDITAVHSPILNTFLVVAPFYPLLLLAGVAAACWRLLRRDSTASDVLISAAFLAVIMTAPLYTVYVIPRYVIGAVMLAYLLGAEALSGPWIHPTLSGKHGSLVS